MTTASTTAPPADPPDRHRSLDGPDRPIPTVAQLRHRAEVPLLVLCTLVTVAGVTVAAVATAHGLDVPHWAAVAVLGLLTPAAGAMVVIRWLFWRNAANSVLVTDQSLPALDAIYRRLAATMGLAVPPPLYVRNSNGVLTAWAAKCQFRRSYVVIGSDLTDLAYEHGEWATVQFVLAHELAHVRCGHVALWRTAITALPRLIGLDRSLTRAQEYTADRAAAHHAPDGALGLLALFGGKHLHRHIDIDGYLADTATRHDAMWLRIVNLLSTHPVGIRRMQTLARVQTEGWDVHGRMV